MRNPDVKIQSTHKDSSQLSLHKEINSLFSCYSTHHKSSSGKTENNVGHKSKNAIHTGIIKQLQLSEMWFISGALLPRFMARSKSGNEILSFSPSSPPMPGARYPRINVFEYRINLYYRVQMPPFCIVQKVEWPILGLYI